MFNLNDPAPRAGYLQSVTVEFDPKRLPSSKTTIWIYTIVPSPGGYIACQLYKVPSKDISQISTKQKYVILTNTMSVAVGTFIGIGISDESVGISTTSVGNVLHITTSNLASKILDRSLNYFGLYKEPSGIRLSYTIIN